MKNHFPNFFRKLVPFKAPKRSNFCFEATLNLGKEYKMDLLSIFKRNSSVYIFFLIALIMLSHFQTLEH